VPGSTFTYSAGAGGCGGSNGGDGSGGGNGTTGGNSTFSGTAQGGTPVSLQANWWCKRNWRIRNWRRHRKWWRRRCRLRRYHKHSWHRRGTMVVVEAVVQVEQTTVRVVVQVEQVPITLEQNYGGGGAGGGDSQGGRGGTGAILITYATTIPLPATPTISSNPATCLAPGSSTISNYDATTTYNFTPAGPTVGAGGVISNMTVGTSYTVTAGTGACTSAPSASFSNAAGNGCSRCADRYNHSSYLLGRWWCNKH
jgi:hypothetical protein